MSGTFTEDNEDVSVAMPLWRQRHVQVIGAVVLVVVAIAFTHGGGKTKQTEPAKAQQAFIGDVVPYTPPAPAPAPQPAPLPAAASPAPAPAIQTPAILPAIQPMTQRVQLKAASDRPAMVSFAVRDWPAASAGDPPRQPGSGAPDRGSPQTRLVFNGADIPAAEASAAVDETFMLDPGLLPCVLDTAIDSDLPGPLLCHLPGPVYSARGVLLMEAGTQVLGKYESVSRASQNRLQAVSAFAHTPNGVWVPLTDETMADGLGRSGLPGEVDQRLFQRFGAAILVSLTDAGLGILQSSVSKGGNTYLSFTNGGVTSLAQDILRSQINIPPLFHKRQGETIALWITRPIDFSASYKVKPIN